MTPRGPHKCAALWSKCHKGLRPIEAKVVDDLFVQGGYVLNFTNQTFSEFFCHEVGVEIYDELYGFRGNSKGKRLVGFTQKAQPKAIAKALAGL